MQFSSFIKCKYENCIVKLILIGISYHIIRWRDSCARFISLKTFAFLVYIGYINDVTRINKNLNDDDVYPHPPQPQSTPNSISKLPKTTFSAIQQVLWVFCCSKHTLDMVLSIYHNIINIIAWTAKCFSAWLYTTQKPTTVEATAPSN